MPADDPITPEVEYREIPGLEGYRFGADGSAWSRWIPHSGAYPKMGDEWRPLKTGKGRKGYKTISLRVPESCAQLPASNSRTRQLHAMIATAFYGPCPPGLECRHLDDNPANCAAGNLVWGTRKENFADRKRNGTQQAGEECHLAKLTDDKVRLIRIRYAEVRSYRKVGEEFGVWFTTVQEIIKGNTWRHVV